MKMQVHRIQSNNYNYHTNFKSNRTALLQKSSNIYRTKPMVQKVAKPANFIDKGLQAILMTAMGTPIGMGIGAYIASLFDASTSSGMLGGMLGGMGLGLFIGVARYFIAASNPDNDFPELGSSETVDLLIRGPYAAYKEAREESAKQREYARKYGPPPAAERREYIPDSPADRQAQEWDRKAAEAREKEAERRIRRALRLD